MIVLSFLLVLVILLCLLLIRDFKKKKSLNIQTQDVPNVSKPVKKKISKKTVIIALLLIFALIGIIVGVILYNDTAWQRNFKITYIGCEYDLHSEEYGTYYYTLENLTQKTFKNVKAVIHVNNVFGDFSFEDSIGTIRQHELVEYDLRWSAVQNAAEKHNIKKIFASDVEIERLIWS